LLELQLDAGGLVRLHLDGHRRAPAQALSAREDLLHADREAPELEAAVLAGLDAALELGRERALRGRRRRARRDDRSLEGAPVGPEDGAEDPLAAVEDEVDVAHILARADRDRALRLEAEAGRARLDEEAPLVEAEDRVRAALGGGRR